MSALALFAVSCGGAKPEAHSADTAPVAKPADGAKKSFDDMSQEERVALMKDVVVPRMKEQFQAAEPGHFNEFGCTTCHGPSAKQGRFKMPNAELPKLNPAGGFAEHMKDEEGKKMVAFMRDKVVPQMAEILGEPAWNPATQSGFGCGECHEMQQ
jgi:hypothetical protein